MTNAKSSKLESWLHWTRLKPPSPFKNRFKILEKRLLRICQVILQYADLDILIVSKDAMHVPVISKTVDTISHLEPLWNTYIGLVKVGGLTIQHNGDASFEHTTKCRFISAWYQWSNLSSTWSRAFWMEESMGDRREGAIAWQVGQTRIVLYIAEKISSPQPKSLFTPSCSCSALFQIKPAYCLPGRDDFSHLLSRSAA